MREHSASVQRNSHNYQYFHPECQLTPNFELSHHYVIRINEYIQNLFVDVTTSDIVIFLYFIMDAAYCSLSPLYAASRFKLITALNWLRRSRRKVIITIIVYAHSNNYQESVITCAFEFAKYLK